MRELNSMKKKKCLLFLVMFILAAVCTACAKQENDKTDGAKKSESKSEIKSDTKSESKPESNGHAQTSSEGIYEAINIQKPDKSNVVQSICYLDNGALRIVTTDENMFNPIIWDSPDGGITWQEVSKAAELINKKPEEGIINVFLSPIGDMTILYGYMGVDLTNISEEEYNNAYGSKQDILYWVDENKKAKEIPITVENSYSYQYSDDGTLYTSNEKEICMLDKKTGNMTKTFPFQENENIYLDKFVVSGEWVTLFVKDIENQNQNGSKLYQYNIKTDEKIELASEAYKKLVEEINFNITYAMKGDDTGFYFASNGLYKYNSKEKSVTEIVPKIQANMLEGAGLLTDIAVNSKADGFVLLVQESQSNISYLYYFTNSETEKQARLGDLKELNIYSMKDNMFLRQAIALYEEDNPGIRVNYQIGYTDEDGIEISDAIRSLNTEILAGKGPDILLLDELPSNKYAEMGVLEDVTELIEAISKKEKLFMNIIESSNKDGKIEVIPTKFIVPILIGDEETVNAGNTKELAQLMEQKSSGNIPVVVSYNFTIGAIELFVTSTKEIFDEEGKVNKEGLKSYYEELKKIADVSISEVSDEDKKNFSLMPILESYPDISSSGGVNIYFEEAQMEIGTFMFGEALEAVNSLGKLKGMKYNYLNHDNGNSFIPGAMMGINHMAENKEDAKAFLEFYLSDEVQKLFLNGFSINKESFLKIVETSENGESSIGYYKDMESDEGMVIYKLTSQEMETFAAFMEKLNTPVNVDKKVMEAVMEQADTYILDGGELNAAVDAVVKKVDIYMSE